jgi:hypothetical protein
MVLMAKRKNPAAVALEKRAEVARIAAAARWAKAKEE